MASGMQPFVWLASPARTIALWGYAGPAPQSRLPTAIPLRWPDLAPGATKDFTLDATALLDPAGDALTAFTVNPAGLVLLAPVVLGGRLILWLTGGVSGTDYPIDITLTTASTRFVERIVRLRVA